MKFEESQQVSSRLRWRKSSYSDDKGECVEVADDVETASVFVRDTKNRHAGTLAFTASAWVGFIQSVPTDLPRHR